MNLLRYEITDQKIKMGILDMYQNSRSVDGKDIRVYVDRGVVTLRGSVKSAIERDYAIAMLGLIQGVEEVISKLVVKNRRKKLPIEVIEKREAT